MAQVEKAVSRFRNEFGQSVTPRVFRAPGRVNLIGEHTDYNDGFVLPIAIDRHTVVAARPRKDTLVRTFAIDLDQRDTFDLARISQARTDPWKNYPRGTAWSLLRNGHILKGADIAVTSRIPMGAGLSSSAALEVGFGFALLALSGIQPDLKDLARSAQRAENEFAGVQCGIMDPFISCMGKKDHAVRIDCRSMEYDFAPLPPDAAVIIVDSGVKRSLRDMEYNERRSDCESAAKALNVTTLRDVDETSLYEGSHLLPDTIFRRACHVVTENRRTLDAVTALGENDLPRFGRLMTASHESLRYNYEVSCPELDQLVEIAQGLKGIYGARLTGAGFGGCIVALADRDSAPELAREIVDAYILETGREGKAYLCLASDGVREVMLPS